MSLVTLRTNLAKLQRQIVMESHIVGEVLIEVQSAVLERLEDSEVAEEEEPLKLLSIGMT